MSPSKRTKKEIYKERLEVYNREAHLITGVKETVAGRSTVQLYTLTQRGAPRPVGSGVLFRAGDKVFILTAAHVADEFKTKAAYVTYQDRLLKVQGQTHASPSPASGDRKDDILDFAVVRIDGEPATLLGASAITVADIYNLPPAVLPGKGLVLVGFPARNFKIEGRVVSSAEIAVESRGVPLATYERLKLEPQNHLILQWYNTMYTEKGVVRSHSMAGMSGGGVWLVPELVGEAFPAQAPFIAPKLMGIFTEHRKSRSILLAVRVRFLLNKIIERYPNLPLRCRIVGYSNDNLRAIFGSTLFP